MQDLEEFFPRESNITTGKKIRAYRKAYKLTQEQLAEMIEIDTTNLSKIENDSREIGLMTAKKFCAIFNVTIEDLIYPNGIENDELVKKIKKKKIVKDFLKSMAS